MGSTRQALLTRKGHAYLATLGRWYLGGVFVYASLHKIAHPGSFALDIATYDILPLSFVNLLAIVLPWIEMFSGAMLILGLRTRAASLTIGGMLILFMIALVVALASGMDVSCGCFASQGIKEEDPISWFTVLRDAGWFLLSMYILLLDRNPIGLDRLMICKSEKVHV